jgi:hypothetical protein
MLFDGVLSSQWSKRQGPSVESKSEIREAKACRNKEASVEGNKVQHDSTVSRFFMLPFSRECSRGNKKPGLDVASSNWELKDASVLVLVQQRSCIATIGILY